MSEAIEQGIVVRGMLPDIFSLWANFENFPRFMRYIQAVTRTGERTSHWVMEGPLGTRLEWEAEITELEPNRAIAWRSLDSSSLRTSGRVTFRELSPNETEIRVAIRYDPPAGAAGEMLAEVFANPDRRVQQDLERFKDYVESTAERIHDTPED